MEIKNLNNKNDIEILKNISETYLERCVLFTLYEYSVLKKSECSLGLIENAIRRKYPLRNVSKKTIKLIVSDALTSLINNDKVAYELQEADNGDMHIRYKITAPQLKKVTYVYWTTIVNKANRLTVEQRNLLNKFRYFMNNGEPLFLDKLNDTEREKYQPVLAALKRANLVYNREVVINDEGQQIKRENWRLSNEGLGVVKHLKKYHMKPYYMGLCESYIERDLLCILFENGIIRGKNENFKYISFSIGNQFPFEFLDNYTRGKMISQALNRLILAGKVDCGVQVSKDGERKDIVYRLSSQEEKRVAKIYNNKISEKANSLSSDQKTFLFKIYSNNNNKRLFAEKLDSKNITQCRLILKALSNKNLLVYRKYYKDSDGQIIEHENWMRNTEGINVVKYLRGNKYIEQQEIER